MQSPGCFASFPDGRLLYFRMGTLRRLWLLVLHLAHTGLLRWNLAKMSNEEFDALELIPDFDV